jgi:hypothetical protein
MSPLAPVLLQPEPLEPVDEVERDERLGLLVGELPRPLHPAGVVGARPRALVLPVEHRPATKRSKQSQTGVSYRRHEQVGEEGEASKNRHLPGWVAPVVPPARDDDVVHVGVGEDDPGEGAPGAAQVERAGPRHPAVDEREPGVLQQALPALRRQRAVVPRDRVHMATLHVVTEQQPWDRNTRRKQKAKQAGRGRRRARPAAASRAAVPRGVLDRPAPRGQARPPRGTWQASGNRIAATVPAPTTREPHEGVRVHLTPLTVPH